MTPQCWPLTLRLGPWTLTVWRWAGPDWRWLRDQPLPQYGWRLEVRRQTPSRR